MQQGAITLLGVKAGYLEARRLAKEKGGRLPSNVLHDEYLVRSDRWKAIARYYAAWAREILVYPAKGGKFKEGKDIVDSGTGWILPASYVPKEAFEKTGVGLFVDPAEVGEEHGRIIVHPKSGMIVLAPFIQENGNFGKVEKTTRIPLALKCESEASRRWLSRIDGVGVRPLVRGRILLFNGPQDVDASQLPGVSFGVALEDAPAESSEENGWALSEKKPRAVIAGITADQLKLLVANAQTSLVALAQEGAPAEIERILKLLQALRKIE